MNGTPARRVISRSASAVSIAWASLSMTHGPAISVSAPPPRRTPATSTVEGTTRLPYHGRGGRMTLRDLVAMTRFDKSGEQGMRLERLRLELGVELDRNVERMRWQLDDLDELAVDRTSHDFETL